MPDTPSDANAARSYSSSDLYAFLAHYTLSRDIGSDWNYSNLGYWLLGEALAARYTKFETLMRARILFPLENDPIRLRAVATDDGKSCGRARFAAARAFVRGRAAPMGLMPAAGLGFYSTNDALTFLSACDGLHALAAFKGVCPDRRHQPADTRLRQCPGLGLDADRKGRRLARIPGRRHVWIRELPRLGKKQARRHGRFRELRHRCERHCAPYPATRFSA